MRECRRTAVRQRPLPSAILMTPAVALARKINPLGMTKLVAHKREPRLATCKRDRVAGRVTSSSLPSSAHRGPWRRRCPALKAPAAAPRRSVAANGRRSWRRRTDGHRDGVDHLVQCHAAPHDRRLRRQGRHAVVQLRIDQPHRLRLVACARKRSGSWPENMHST